VIATDRDLKGLDGLGCDRHQLDVTDGVAIVALAKKIGKIDVLFNCAGFVENGTILDNDDAQWEKSFEINVYAMARMIKAFLPAMIDNGGGSIINVASVAGSIKGIPNRCIYGASKAAVIGLTNRWLPISSPRPFVATRCVRARWIRHRCNSGCATPAIMTPRARPLPPANHGTDRNRRGSRLHGAVAGQRRFHVRHRTEFHPRWRDYHLGRCCDTGFA